MTFDDSESSHNSLDEEDSVSSNDSKNNGYSNSSSNDSDIIRAIVRVTVVLVGVVPRARESSSSEADEL